MLMTRRCSMHNTRRIVALMAALLCGLTACVKRTRPQVSSNHPDKVLFERAMLAVQHSRFDVAHITLQTLVNT